MATVNIRRDVKDSFYRYKMPKLISKVEGKGNGIKTVVPNMTDIARALSRPATYPTKFFGCELGAQVKCDEKNDRYIVNGAHDAEKLQVLLDGFIQKFVLCPSCQNPETDLHITKGDDIEMDCKACGARNLGDMRHKLASYIVKNPPESASKKGKKQRKAATAQTNGTDENGIPETNMEEADEAAGSDDDIITQRINKEAAGLKLESTMGEDDWSVDTSEEAVAARMKELSVKASLLGDEEDEEGESKYEQFGQWLEENKEGTDADIIAKAEELGVLGKYKVCQVLVQCIFNENITTQIPKRVKLLRKFVNGEKHQRAVLGGIERLVGLEYKDKLLSKVPIILKKLYDADIVEEDALLKWGEKPSKRYVDKDTSKAVKKSAAPFLDWLQNASEEESDDE
ncbi:hypothetical protein NQZ79_g4935 [Umbelopsis isabellina]|nr:hypothetical protein NQZ79_g4935 [Umbelopsis isabellina]